MSGSWFTGTCKKCGFPVVVTQPTEPGRDYWWYCSSKVCEYHAVGEQTGDMEWPEWVLGDSEKEDYYYAEDGRWSKRVDNTP